MVIWKKITRNQTDLGHQTAGRVNKQQTAQVLDDLKVID